jgi:hypothetical protein
VITAITLYLFSKNTEPFDTMSDSTKAVFAYCFLFCVGASACMDIGIIRLLWSR